MQAKSTISLWESAVNNVNNSSFAKLSEPRYRIASGSSKFLLESLANQVAEAIILL